MKILITGGPFLNHLCDDEQEFLKKNAPKWFLNHLCDDELTSRLASLWDQFLNHLCDDELF